MPVYNSLRSHHYANATVLTSTFPGAQACCIEAEAHAAAQALDFSAEGVPASDLFLSESAGFSISITIAFRPSRADLRLQSLRIAGNLTDLPKFIFVVLLRTCGTKRMEAQIILEHFTRKESVIWRNLLEISPHKFLRAIGDSLPLRLPTLSTRHIHA